MVPSQSDPKITRLKSSHSVQLNGGLTFLTPSAQSPSLSTLKVHLQKQLFREDLTRW